MSSIRRYRRVLVQDQNQASIFFKGKLEEQIVILSFIKTHIKFILNKAETAINTKTIADPSRPLCF